MKLRYMRDQKEQLRKEIQNSRQTRKKMKFNLGDSDEEVDFLTHKGKKLGEL